MRRTARHACAIGALALTAVAYVQPSWLAALALCAIALVVFELGAGGRLR